MISWKQKKHVCIVYILQLHQLDTFGYEACLTWDNSCMVTYMKVHIRFDTYNYISSMFKLLANIKIKKINLENKKINSNKYYTFNQPK